MVECPLVKAILEGILEGILEIVQAMTSLIMALLWLVVPGMIIGYAAGLQALTRWAAAPALSLGLMTITVWSCVLLGLPWSISSVVLVMSILLVLLSLPRSLQNWRNKAWAWIPRFGYPRRLMPYFALGSILAVLPFMLVNHWLLDAPQTWDSIFHLSATRLLRTFEDPSPFRALKDLYAGQEHYYPHTFHAVASLLSGNTLIAHNSMVAVSLIMWPWQVGAFSYYILLRLKAKPKLSFWATVGVALAAASGVGFPSLISTAMALPPYLLSLCVTPGFLLLNVELVHTFYSKHATARFSFFVVGFVWLIALGGVVGTHPSSLFNLVLLGIYPLGLNLWLLLDRMRTWRSKTLVLLLLFGVLTLVAVFLMPRLISMSYYRRGSINPLFIILCALTDYPLSYRVPFLVFGGLPWVLWGIWGAWHYRKVAIVKYLSAGIVFALGMALLAAGPDWWGRSLTAPWYLQATRLLPLVNLCVLPLCALGMYQNLQFVCTKFSIRKLKRVLAGSLAVLLVLTGGFSVPARYHLARVVYDPDIILWGNLLSRGEKDFLIKSSAALDPNRDRVWADPFSGAPYYWIVTGRRVVLPSLNLPNEGDAHYLIDNMRYPEARKQVCDAMKRLGITHYYQDTDPSGFGALHKGRVRPFVEDQRRFEVPPVMLKLVDFRSTVNAKSRPEAVSDPHSVDFVGQRLFRVSYDSCS